MTTHPTPVELADRAAETVRDLNYATLPWASGLAFPGDAYSTVGNLSMLAMRLPQALRQITGFIDRQHEQGALYSDQGTDSLETRIAMLRSATDAAVIAADALYAALEQAHGALSPIGAQGYGLDDEPYEEADDCPTCEAEQDSGEVYPHCCGCGADGSSERPDCTCG
ncbi:hypothetical protein [Streptomyces sp. NBC_00483]|uniref:hypothetical protein n=1 Tax=Streptomyces sp. NBC_00483 TaxID=2975756 RepID=UPI002E176EF8